MLRGGTEKKLKTERRQKIAGNFYAATARHPSFSVEAYSATGATITVIRRAT